MFDSNVFGILFTVHVSILNSRHTVAIFVTFGNGCYSNVANIFNLKIDLKFLVLGFFCMSLFWRDGSHFVIFGNGFYSKWPTT